jgi:trimethylamine---corrinoid protein Co-methyltransferase
MKLNRMAVLSESEVKAIHEATVDILSNCGVKILNPRMLDFLAGKGLAVDREKQIVRISRACLEDALSKIPRRFEMFDRNGKALYELGDGNTKIGAGHNAVFWLDSETGETRRSKVYDVEMFARICEQLDVIDIIGIPVMPQDVPNAKATLLYGVRACVENSVKPIYFSTDSARVNRGCIELLREAFSGNLADQAYGISQLSPTSPLFWESSVIDAITDTINQGVPLAILPEPNAGVSCPYTLAGLLTMNNAECLSGLIMAQLLKPGSKVLYANSWTATDMRSGAALVSSLETSLCRVAGTQLGQFYKIPTHTTAPNSDNHAHDEQAAWERTYSLLSAAAVGTDLAVNCGMFATGMTCSHEQLVIDSEIAALTRRFAAGLEVTPETIAADLIKRIGPQGENYMMEDHTLRWLRSNEYVATELSVRGPFSAWKAKGAKDTYQLARDKVKTYAAATASAPLAKNRRQKLDDIISSFIAEKA